MGELAAAPPPRAEPGVCLLLASATDGAFQVATSGRSRLGDVLMLWPISLTIAETSLY